MYSRAQRVKIRIQIDVVVNGNTVAWAIALSFVSRLFGVCEVTKHAK